MALSADNWARLRRIWANQSGLGQGQSPWQGVPSGWPRALGGIDPYISLWARDPQVKRQDIDQALVDGDLWILPGVRGCIWLVSKADAAFSLKVGNAIYQKRNQRDMRKLEIPQSELDTLGVGILEALKVGPLSPDGIRQALPPGLCRSLGDAGKKIGHTTTLPMTLRGLEAGGHIRRLPETGRLDTQRYLWQLADIHPYTVSDVPDPAAHTEMLAQHYFKWTGPSQAEAFIQWGTLGKRDAKKALDALGCVPYLDGDMDDLILPESQIETLDDSPSGSHFLPSLDNLLSMRLRPADTARAAHHNFELLGMGSRKTPLHKAKWLGQRPWVHDGEWVGLWSWHLDESRVIFSAFAPVDGAVKQAAQGKAAALGDFIRDELDGSVRNNGLDSQKSQKRRMQAILEMGDLSD